ncbi:MAG: electron transfer flavoprotein subunit beta/FixA family protein [Nitrososphaeraceae archaeon]
MNSIGVAVIVKLEPDFSEGNVSYNSDGTLNRAETKNILGPHSAIACSAAFYSKVNYGAEVFVATMGPPIADYALQQAQLISNADHLYLYSDRIFAGADTLATAEVLRCGIKSIQDQDRNVDIIFSGHRASDGETGQTGPQTAWKLGYTFLGNVISYKVDIESRKVRATRLISLQGFYDVVEEVEASLPVFMTVDPSYKAQYDTVTQRLAHMKNRKDAFRKSQGFRNYLQVINAQQLGVDAKFVGLPGSPTIVYKVEKIPKAKPTRKVLVINGSDPNEIKKVVSKMNQVLGGMVIK